MRDRRTFLLVLLVSLVVGCGEGAAPMRERTSRSDSAGVRIAISDLSDLPSLPVCRIPDQPSLQIGTNESRPEAQLFRVEDAFRLGDGRLVVLNRGTREILVFDENGAFQRRIGSKGEGPGEFQDPIEFHLFASDSIAVWDWALNRISILAPDLAFERSLAPHPLVPNPTGDFGVIANGKSFVISFLELRIPTGASFVPQFIPLLRFSADGALEDTVVVLPNGRAGVIDLESRMLGSPLFEPRSSFATDGQGLYFTTGFDPEVRVLNGSLQLVRLIRWRTPDRRVTNADVEVFKSERLEGVDEQMLPLMRKRYESVPVSENYPTASALLVDDHRRLWVQRFQRPRSETQMWWSFDETGAFRCTVSLPERLRVKQFGDDFLTAVATDDLGVESVVVFPVSDPES